MGVCNRNVRRETRRARVTMNNSIQRRDDLHCYMHDGSSPKSDFASS